MFIELGQYRLTCYPPENKDVQNAVYIHTDAQDAEEIFKLTDRNFALIAIDGIDWNRDLTPWQHEKVFAKGEDFAGKADDYLAVLTEKLIPAAEQEFALNIDKRYLVGYSLSGLFAVYAIYHTAIFDGIGSISGSLWYDGFTDYVKSHTVKRNPDKMYFSLGDKEASSARGIMQTVLVRTEQLEEKYRNDGIKTILEMNEGKHFTNVHERIVKGIKWLLS
ncbi:MAG: alpha/beta hydrolase-fold protein [Clostridiales bacterium]|nr:alpha/beta hydrolase-fold protein [Clostridiales bacterium]